MGIVKKDKFFIAKLSVIEYINFLQEYSITSNKEDVFELYMYSMRGLLDFEKVEYNELIGEYSEVCIDYLCNKVLRHLKRLKLEDSIDLLSLCECYIIIALEELYNEEVDYES